MQKIAFKNGYGLKQSYLITSSSPETVVVRDEITPKIAPNEDYLIQLLFIQQRKSGSKQVIVRSFMA